jgi:hypothetical protein
MLPCRSSPPALAAVARCAGFNAVDVLALGALGHVIGVGIVLGLKATGE